MKNFIGVMLSIIMTLFSGCADLPDKAVNAENGKPDSAANKPVSVTNDGTDSKNDILVAYFSCTNTTTQNKYLLFHRNCDKIITVIPL